jgi:hypothetical protein
MAFIDTLFQVYVPAILIIIALTFVFVDWPGWRWVEHLIVGSGAGVIVATNWQALLRSGINPLLGGDFLLIIPLLSGIAMYFRYIPTYKWVERYGFLWVIAGGTGVTISLIFQGQVLPQVLESIKIVRDTPIDTFNAIISLLIFLTTLSYFTFTREHTGVLGQSARLGRLFLMVGFGLGFSTLIQTYFAVLLERIQWLLFNLLGIS